jgi:hypothetical protein
VDPTARSLRVVFRVRGPRAHDAGVRTVEGHKSSLSLEGPPYAAAIEFAGVRLRGPAVSRKPE